MTLAQILESEDQNTDKIYFYLEGTFLKAYERSAFLFHTYIQEFKLSRRFVKYLNRHIISLGIPFATKKKWLHGFPVKVVMDGKCFIYDIGKTVDEVEYDHWLEMAEATAAIRKTYTPQTALIERQPVYKNAYDALLMCNDFSKNIAKYLRDPYSSKLKNLAYNIVYGTKSLYDVTDRNTLIDNIQADCRELCFVLQVLKDIKEISLASFALSSERIVSVSKQLESLRKTVGTNNKPTQ